MFLLRRHATMSLRETDPHLAEASLWDSALAKLARRLPVHLKKGPRFDPTRSRCRSSDGILAYRAASRSGISCNKQARAEKEDAGDKVCLKMLFLQAVFIVRTITAVRPGAACRETSSVNLLKNSSTAGSNMMRLSAVPSHC